RFRTEYQGWEVVITRNGLRRTSLRFVRRSESSSNLMRLGPYLHRISLSPPLKSSDNSHILGSAPLDAVNFTDVGLDGTGVQSVLAFPHRLRALRTIMSSRPALRSLDGPPAGGSCVGTADLKRGSSSPAH